ncbi:MAG: hypothetical protein KTR26_15370 [Flammeovirgaceae bacterium]|nr:hypothetical protein [Flammeovirgaceae bacterium]
MNTFSWNYGIQDLNGKADFTYFLKPNLNTKFGANIIHHRFDYIDHASLVQNPYLEGEIRPGKDKSYGVEFFLKKNTGNLTDWLGYTISKATLEIEIIELLFFFAACAVTPYYILIQPLKNRFFNKKYQFLEKGFNK